MKIAVVGAASGWGAQIRACEEGPEALLNEELGKILHSSQLSITSSELLFPQKKASEISLSLAESFPLICEFNKRLEDAVSQAVIKGAFPLILGGDHSIAVGTWKGVRKASSARDSRPLGLIWIDAHMDSHTPETTPSGAWHGMPLAALMGYGRSEWAEKIFLPQHICLIGTRSYEKGEAELLARLNVRIYDMKNVRDRGLKDIFKEAILHVSQETSGFGVSLDLDAIEPKEAPGVGSPESGGIHVSELLEVIPLLSRQRNFLALEVVEYNPQRDIQKKTAAAACCIIQEVLYGL